MDRDELNRHPSKGPDFENEADHFQHCKECGQSFDRRNLGDVVHHMQRDCVRSERDD